MSLAADRGESLDDGEDLATEAAGSDDEQWWAHSRSFR
jgi:hypothetical protein